MVGRFKRALLEKGDMSGMTQKGGHKRSTESGAGLTQKGVEKYRRQNPGSKLKTAVTTPPSKLKPGSKAAKRRKSFCARSRSWTGERGKAARRRWNCSTDANPNTLDRMTEMVLERFSTLNRALRKKRVKSVVRGRKEKFNRDMDNMSDADRRKRYEVEYKSDDSYRRGEPDSMRSEDIHGQLGRTDPIARNTQKLVRTIQKRGSKGQEDVAQSKRAEKEKKNIKRANQAFLKWGIDRNDQ